MAAGSTAVRAEDRRGADDRPIAIVGEAELGDDLAGALSAIAEDGVGGEGRIGDLSGAGDQQASAAAARSTNHLPSRMRADRRCRPGAR